MQILDLVDGRAAKAAAEASSDDDDDDSLGNLDDLIATAQAAWVDWEFDLERAVVVAAEYVATQACSLSVFEGRTKVTVAKNYYQRRMSKPKTITISTVD